MDSIWTKDGGDLSTVVGTVNSRSKRRHQRVRQATILVDLVLVNLGFWLAYLARYDWQWLREVEPQYEWTFRAYFPQMLLFNAIIIVLFARMGIWWRRRGEFFVDEVSRIAYALATTLVLLMAYQYFFRPEANSRIMLFWSALFTGVLLAISRLFRRWMLRIGYRNGVGVDKVVVVGSGEAGRGVIRTLLARTDLGFQALGFLDDGSEALGSRRIPYLGSWEDLGKTISRHPDLHTVFIAMPAERQEDILQIAKMCLDKNIRAQIVPDLLQLSLGRVELNNMGGIPMLSIRDVTTNRFGRFIKRMMDITMVGILAIPALFVGGVIAIAIKLEDGGPIFYHAKRAGRGGNPIYMLKFRSMVTNADALRAQLWEQNDAEGAIFKIKDDPRVTRVGKFIRAYSLDELPQIWNIAKGDMSLVGPRPPIEDEVAQYEDWHMRRLDVQGGLTGLWQVSGRADLTFDEAVLLDIYYIENWSLALDLRIILQTIPYVLLKRGAY